MKQGIYMLSVVTLTATALAAACGGGDSPNAPPPAAPPADASTGDAPPPIEGRPDLSLAVAAPTATTYLLQGGRVDLAIKLTRGAGVRGAVRLAARSLPADVTAAEVVVPAGASEGVLTLQAALAAKQARGPIEISAAEEGTRVVGTAAVDLFVRGPAGSLDTTFGEGGVQGKWFMPATGFLTDGAELPDGGLVVVGQRNNNLIAARLTPSGVIDTTYAGGGITNLAVKQGGLIVGLHGPSSPRAGGITAMGASIYPSLYMLDPGGNPVTSFNLSGTRDIDVGAQPVLAGDMRVLPDGRILSLTAHGAPASRVMEVRRWNLDGSVDMTYGTGGACELPLTTGRFMTVAADGAARAIGGGTLVGCTATGTRDTTLGTAPDHTVAVGSVGSVLAAAPDGTTVAIVAGGYSRISATGVIDLSIGTTGKVPVGPADELQAIALQADGKVVVGGYEDRAFKIWRFLPNGLADTAFGTNGVVRVDVANPANTAFLYRLLVSADGRRLFAIGVRYDVADGAVARLWL